MKQPTIVPENSFAPGEGAIPFESADDYLSAKREAETSEEAEAQGPETSWRFWSDQITAALTHEKLFRAEGEASERVYFGPQQNVQTDGSDPGALITISEKTALIHANVDVLKPLIYSETPQPVVRRRYNGDNRTDETDLMATEAIQRLATYLLDTEDFDGAMEGARDDWLIAGRGAASVIYKARTELVDEPVLDAMGQPAIDPVTGQAAIQQVEKVIEQRVSPRHREWRRVLFAPGHAWDDLPWLAIEHSMTRSKCEKRFPGKVLAYNTPGLVKSTNAAEDDDKALMGVAAIAPTNETNATTISPFDTTTVWEIWNKDEGKVIWWSPAFTGGILDEVDDPLQLADFYPMPAPLTATAKGRRLTPRPDIRYYEARAEEIEIASKKMGEILKVIAVAGLIPASASTELKKLFEGRNQLIPVEAWLTLMQKGSVGEMIQWLPLAPMTQALQALQQLRMQARDALFEASGVSDIMRAQGDPNETATAQQIKSKYSGLRLSSRQRVMALFALDMLRMMIDVATGVFDSAYLLDLVGLDLPFAEAERQAEIARRQQEQESYEAQAQLHAVATQIAQEQAAAQQAAAAPPPVDPMAAMGQGGAPVDVSGGAATGASVPPQSPPPMESPLDPGPPPVPPQYDKPVPDTSWELVHARIKSDLRRKISISIETSSTILADEASDKDARVEFIGAFAQFVQALMPMVAAGQMPLATMKEMLLFGVRGFPKSRTLETLISQLPDELPPAPEQQEEVQITVAKINAEAAAMLQKDEHAFELQMNGVELLTEGVRKAGEVNEHPLEKAASRADEKERIEAKAKAPPPPRKK